MEFRAGGGRDSSLQVAPTGQVLLVRVKGFLKLLGPELDRRVVILWAAHFCFVFENRTI